MSASRLSRLILGAGSALAVLAASAALPAEAKGPKFKPSFVAKLPGEPKGATTFKATTKGPTAAGTGYVYDDSIGQLHLVGLFSKQAGFTQTTGLFDVMVAGGMDLTDVTFPVSRPALITYLWNKTTVQIKPPFISKTVSNAYSPAPAQNTVVTITSYDPVKQEMRGTLSGDLQFNQNESDPSDDARDGKVITLKNAKFALKPLGN
jgi:hypothetical protein